ncbi:TMEM175 family protein [Companilactobacillus metriopterae]|uniref:TMEM175 family protein n=1 Tax=Companilactobacillus metriopterae TaxID=1909267 RepID=UPI00100A7EDE|nr:TMEM175 family protein [Companilactobacillus metriopterae]
MNKSRVEAFTDAVLAIILTIMVLEIKIPESTHLSAILEELPYILSYAVGWLFIGVAWYNHHYMFSKTKVVSRKVFWVNNFWMFSTSFLPVATAWIGKDINARGPQIFYTIVYVIWSIAYGLLTYVIISENEKSGHIEIANDIRSMAIYKVLTNWKLSLVEIVLVVLILIYMPALLLLLVTLQIIFVGARFNADSDKLF